MLTSLFTGSLVDTLQNWQMASLECTVLVEALRLMGVRRISGSCLLPHQLHYIKYGMVPL